MSNPKLSTCCSCGFQWPTGQHGEHSCSSYLSTENKMLKEQVAELKAENRKERDYSVFLERSAENLLEQREALRKRVGEIKADRDRLNHLDKLNSEFNERNGTQYGWQIDWNHNRIALIDSCPMQKSVREAIDNHQVKIKKQTS